ncbi:MAG: DUF2066 domain-containing protein [Rhodobiaceae bacterium]|nr:hypothetical protein RHODOSMS8_00704 [Rhodobiaceae bacterium]MCR9240551.1 DUF2066 domain-containing protein [Rhodobiaceae bacterium]
MRRQIRKISNLANLSALAGLILLIGTMGTPAAAADVFTVTGISIDATAETATQARNAAVADGQRRALEVLLKRLALQEDWSLLPTVDTNLAEGMVRSFQVANEKRSATRYLANLSVKFQPNAVRNLFTARSIPFSESRERTAVIVPVLTDATGDRLWDEGNAWTAAWAGTDLDNILTPMVVPLGDIGDMTTLTVEQALGGDRPALSNLATRYGADRVIVAHAQTGDTPSALSVRVITYPTGEGAPKSWSGREASAPSLQTAAFRLAGRFVDATQADWKRESTVRFAERAVLSASVAYESIGEWQAIRNRLAQIPLIQKTTIVAISTEGAQVELDYVGTVDTLELNLAQKSLTLNNLEGYWYLAAIR